jgi:predicted RNA-binding Zn-ribbon protein involved in translation (DUF1610 family)
MSEELGAASEGGEHSGAVSASSIGGGELASQVECPFCAEMISARARKCRHCGETVDVAMRKAEEAMRVANTHPSQVFMNAGGGGGAAAAASAAATPVYALRPFNHLLHFIVSVLTGGLWVPFWILMYVSRNRSVYL